MFSCSSTSNLLRQETECSSGAREESALLRSAGGVRLAVRGPVVRACSAGGTDVLYIFGAGWLRISVAGVPRSKIRVNIGLPALPAPPQRLLGPLVPHLAVHEARRRHPLDAYFVALDELVLGTGCNFMSVCPIAYWNELDIGSPFQRSGGRYDLRMTDSLFEGALRCLLWRAARAGVVVHLYPFDFVAFNHPAMWARSPLYYRNNLHGWFTQQAPKGYKGFHAAIKDRDPRDAYETLTAYFRRMARLIDNRHPHAVVPVLEGQSRRTDYVLSGFRAGRTLGVNIKSLYQDIAWPAMAGVLAKDLTWRDYLRSASFVSCHSCDSGGRTVKTFERLLPFAVVLDFSLLASTDGTGSGRGEASRYRRPEGSRPNLDDLVAVWNEGLETAGDRFLGLEIKTLSWDDARSILPAVTGRIDITT